MTRDPWYVSGAKERGRLIAEFLVERLWTRAAKASWIAGLPGCPIRPPGEAEFLADYARCAPEDRPLFRPPGAQVGGESHCQRVTAALNAAVKLGLVEKTRIGKGPWTYRAVARLVGGVAFPLEA